MINSRILLSVASIAAAGALVIGATFAFFSDTETSTGNTFVAGELDLKVDSEAHYAGLVCNGTTWVDDSTPGTTRPDLIGYPCDGTWSETDLGAHKFFNLSDIKPGDSGEDTISLHVVDNDAWGWFQVVPTANDDVTCTEPELVVDVNCTNLGNGTGELRGALLFNVWLDQGTTAGFQGKQDSGEGDNIFNFNDVVLGSSGPIDPNGENYNLWQILATVRSGLGDACTATDSDGDGATPGANGACQGLAVDGRLVKSTTYYFGVEWDLPAGIGNEVQTDNFIANMIFKAEQHRNNPSPSPFPTP